MSVAVVISTAYELGHQRVLSLLDRLNEETLHWQPAPHAHSIAFEAWHLGRWADHLYAHLPRMTPGLEALLPPQVEIWHQERLAEAWGFPAAGALGHDETGMYMADDVAIRLPLPEKAALLAYLRSAFAAAENTVQRLPEAQMLEPNRENPQECVLDVLLSHIVHDGRHLGMIESLVGIRNGRGTATV